jgi:glycosyltransferase involved in cell wall biosynthesis
VSPGRNPPNFLAVGRFVDKKAPHLTILAFRSVCDAVPEATLSMIGDGPLLEACRLQARALDLGEAVSFLGTRPHADVAAAMGSARAFVQHSIRPSHGDSEGTPVAILEAGASGLPVIATRHAGIPEAVLEDQTGWLVDEGDVSAMADRMVRVARDAALADLAGRRAREHIAAHYSMEGHIARLAANLNTARATESG